MTTLHLVRPTALAVAMIAAASATLSNGAAYANPSARAHCVLKSYQVYRAPSAQSSGMLFITLGCDELQNAFEDKHEAHVFAPYALGSTFDDLRASGEKREYTFTIAYGGSLTAINGKSVGPMDPLGEAYRQTEINSAIVDQPGSALQRQISKILDAVGAPKIPRRDCDSHHPEKPCLDVVDQRFAFSLPNSKNVTSISLLYSGGGYFHGAVTAGYVNLSLHAIADNRLGQDVTLSTEDAQAIRDAFKLDDLTFLRNVKGESLRIDLRASPRLVWHNQISDAPTSN